MKIILNQFELKSPKFISGQNLQTKRGRREGVGSGSNRKNSPDMFVVIPVSEAEVRRTWQETPDSAPTCNAEGPGAPSLATPSPSLLRVARMYLKIHFKPH